MHADVLRRSEAVNRILRMAWHGMELPRNGLEARAARAAPPDRPVVDARLEPERRAARGRRLRLAATRGAGKAPGILTSVEADARRYLELGALFVAVGLDSALLVRAADALAARFHDEA